MAKPNVAYVVFPGKNGGFHGIAIELGEHIPSEETRVIRRFSADFATRQEALDAEEAVIDMWWVRHGDWVDKE